MRILRPLFSKTVFAVCGAVAIFAGTALANTIQPGQITLPFSSNAGTASGYFVYDPNTNSLVDWNFSLSAGGTDFATVYNKADTTAGATASVFTTPNGDTSFSFFEIENINTATEFTGEFDIVINCFGTANCVQNAAVGTSFALLTGPTPKPCTPNVTQPCTTSQEVDPLDFTQATRYLAPGFLNVADPPVGLAFNMDSAATGTIFTGGSNGGGGSNQVPEPSSLMLLGTGLAGSMGIFRRHLKIAK